MTRSAPQLFALLVTLLLAGLLARAGTLSPQGDRLLLASPEGVVEVDGGGAKLYPLAGAGAAEALAVDRSRSLLWAVTGNELRIFPLRDGLEDGSSWEEALNTAPGEEVLLVADPSEGSAWLASGRRLRAYSAAGQLLHDLELPLPIAALAFQERVGPFLWVAQGSEVVALDSLTATEVHRLQVGDASPIAGLAAGKGGLWVAAGERLTRVTASGERKWSLPLEEPVSMAADEAGGLWVAWPDAVAHLDGSGTPTFLRNVFPGGGEIAALAVGRRGSAWVTDGRRVARLDIAGRELERLAVGLDLDVAREVRGLAVVEGAGVVPTTADLPAVADTYLGPGPKNTNYGEEAVLRLASSDHYRMLVRFALSDLAEEVEVFHRATLELFLETNGGGWSPAGRSVGAFRIEVPWTELGATWSCPDDTDPSNNRADCSTPWNGGAFASAATDAVLHTDGLAGWVSWDVSADVTAVLAGTADDHGWLVKREDGPDSGRATYPSRDSQSGAGPRLVVVYEPNEAPVISIDAPVEGSLLATATPELVFSYSDEGSGVDTESLAVNVNGSPWAVSCSTGEGGAICVPSAVLPEGGVTLSATVADLAGNLSVSASVSFSVDTIPPAAVDPALVEVSPPAEGLVTLTAAAGAAEAGSTVRVTNPRIGQSVEAEAAGDGSFSAQLGGASGDILELISVDRAGNASAGVMVAVPDPPADPDLPPDPTTVAPPLDRTVVTDFFTATEFLYTGPDPIQTGVAPGTIEPRRAAVLRGRVLDRSGAPLPGVRLTVLDHPEYGETLSRADGVFDLVVNGGGLLTLTYRKEGFVSIQRQAEAPWRDYAWAPDVVLLPYSEASTVIPSGAPEAQVARGVEETDADGSRQATLIFPAGTSAELELADGSRQALASMTMRATEYTVGPTGPQAMPGPLPATVGYTYAVELSADEAEAAGAVSVLFSQPVYLYVENFLGFPVGESVPLGYWDRRRAAWVGSPNGRVVEVLGTDGAGLAGVDVDGSGTAADAAALSALGFTDGERQRLGELYPPGTSLWRSPIPHLTPWDCNWPYTAPDDAEFPPDDLEDPFDPEAPNDPDEADDPEDPDAPNDPEDEEADRPDRDEEPWGLEGSVLEVEDQILGESLSLTGSELSLHYRSDRQQGRTAEYRLRTRVTGSSPPASLKRVELRITIAGQSIQRTFIPSPNQVFSMTWNGEDAYSRDLQGRYGATIQKGYVYDGQLRLGGPENPNWALAPSGAGGSFRDTRQGGEIILTRTHRGTVDSLAEAGLGTFDARELGLGGWTLSAHHVYDPNSRTLYLGDGSQRRARHVGPVLRRFAGDGQFAFGGDGGPAVLGQLSGPSGVAVTADGSVLIADADNHRIRRVSPQGILSTFAGSGQACAGGGDPDCPEPDGDCGDDDALEGPGGPPASELESVGEAMGGTGTCGDGGPATDALLSFPRGVAVAPDGAVLVADSGADCVRRIAPSGIIETVAGICRNEAEPAQGEGGDAIFDGSTTETGIGFPDDGFPAIFATLLTPWDVAVAPDGGFYIADRGHRRVGYVSPGGLFYTVAGGGSEPGDDGAEARLADLEDPAGLSLGPAGDLYIAENQGQRVRRLGVDGRLYYFAGTGQRGFSGDGGPALEARLDGPERVLATADGSVYVSVPSSDRVRKIDPAGVILTIAGNGQGGEFAEGGPATGVPLGFPVGLALHPEGDLLISDGGLGSVLKMGRSLAGFGEDEIAVPSTGGSALYVFDAQGRHLRTRHALTGADLYRFEYDDSGLMSAVVDRHEQRTTIERDAAGKAEGITAPSGQRTALVLDAEDYLKTWTNPAGDGQEFLYRLGLLEVHEDPRGHTSTYRHGTFGLLEEATDRSGGLQTFTRFSSPFNPNAGVTALDGVGVSVFYKTFEFRNGTRGQTVNDDSLRIHRWRQERSGLRTVERADGSRSSSREVPDPRFGMAASRTGSFSAELPGGLTMSSTSSTEVSLADPDDPLSLTGLTETVSVNGNTFTSSYDASSGTFTTTSPLGRTSTARIDPLGRLAEQTRAGLVPIRYEYRPDGLLSAVRVGDGAEQRSTLLAYDGQRRLSSVTDPLGRSSSFTYDAANRLTAQTLADGSLVGFGYDASGNLTSLSPPGRGVHTFGFTPLDQVASYQPAGGDPSAATGVGYTAARDLASLTRPGGEAVSFGYDALGRLESLTHGRGVTGFTWDATAGRVGSVTTPEGQALTYGYQGPVRVASTWSGPVAGEVSRTLTGDLKVGTLSVNGELLAGYGYDADGLLTQAGPLTLSRDLGNGRITGTTLGSTVTSRSFNGFGELTGLTATYEASPLYSASYVRDALGRVTSATETVLGRSRTRAYRYDLRGRLEEVEQDGVVVATYTYDANGNRTSYTSPTEALTATYDGQDRLLTYGDLSYATTLAGELASKSQGEATELYSYDAFGNLLRVTKPDGLEIEYVVDGENRRVGKKVAGTLVQGFLYADALSPVAQLDGSGAVVSRFIYGSRGNVPDVLLKDGRTYRIVSDPLGSVRLVVDTETGAIAQELSYDAFGQVQLDTHPGFQPFGYAGGLYDPQTGLVRFGVRDYDPQIGRWTSKDPLGFAAGDPNLYAYVAGDPINGVDPTGQILPALALGYALFEAGSTIYDLYNTYDTLTDPCADLWDKGLASGGVLAGMFLPGGGYGKGAQVGRGLGRRIDDTASAATPVGRRGQQVSFPNPSAPVPRNAPGVVNGREFSGHAFDRIQERGFTPTVVEDVIQNGQVLAGRTEDTIGYFDAVNSINVFVDSATGRVVTVY